MKLVRVVTDQGPRAGVLVDGLVHEIEGDASDEPVPGASIGAWDDLVRLEPCEPSKVIGVGRNYLAHIRERGREVPDEPFTFLMAPNAVVGDGAAVQRPVGAERFDYEGELAVVIGRSARNVAAADALNHVLGYTCGNDFTVRDWQVETRQWVQAKSSDTLCPLGPWIETQIADPEDLALRTRVNGELVQDGRTDDMVFGLRRLIEHISATLTLAPGDVILTGTPSGVGPVVAGDEVEVEIEGIGRLVNRVVDA